MTVKCITRELRGLRLKIKYIAGKLRGFRLERYLSGSTKETTYFCPDCGRGGFSRDVVAEHFPSPPVHTIPWPHGAHACLSERLLQPEPLEGPPPKHLKRARRPWHWSHLRLFRRWRERRIEECLGADCGVLYFCPACGRREITREEVKRYYPKPPPHTQPVSYQVPPEEGRPCRTRRLPHPDLPADS